MPDTIEEQLNMLNRLYKQQNNIYHEVAIHFGLSDATFWILYALCESKQSYSQNDLCNTWFYSKQTVNSVVNSLVQKGYVILKPIPGAHNRKSVVLTQEGKEFCKHRIMPIIDAERQSFLRFNDQDKKTYLSLFQKQVAFLKEEAELLIK